MSEAKLPRVFTVSQVYQDDMQNLVSVYDIMANLISGMDVRPELIKDFAVYFIRHEDYERLFSMRGYTEVRLRLEFTFDVPENYIEHTKQRMQFMMDDAFYKAYKERITPCYYSADSIMQQPKTKQEQRGSGTK